MKKIRKFEELSRTCLKKALYRVLRCNIQHDGWPCGTCFFSLAEDRLDNSDWQSLLYYRGDHELQHLDNLPKMWKRRITKIYNICCDRISKG